MALLQPIGAPRYLQRYTIDSIKLSELRGFASRSLWPSAEFSGVWAYTPSEQKWGKAVMDLGFCIVPWVGRPIRVKVHGSVLHAMLWVGLASA
jgi:hypothetical protein